MNDQPRITTEQAAHLRDLSERCYAMAEATLILAAQLVRVYQPVEMSQMTNNATALFWAGGHFADLVELAEVVEVEA